MNSQTLTHVKTPSIKIFITAHKPSVFPSASLFIPVHAGAAVSPADVPGTVRDDSGDNISSENARYCELTTQYWAWKNSTADYVGFCHYRRHFIFSPERFAENDYGEVLEPFLDERSAQKYGLTDEAMQKAIDGWDIITTPLNDVRTMGGFANLIDQWEADAHLRKQDLLLMRDVVHREQPAYYADMMDVLRGRRASFCNMFIMRKQIFEAYCEWLFPLLAAFDAQSDMSHADTQRLRTVGHLAERLLNVFVLHQMRLHPQLRVRRLQCVHFLQTDPVPDCVQESSSDTEIIPIAFAVSDSYVPMFATAVCSLLAHADPNRRYAIVVLETGITDQNKEELRRQVAAFPNASLMFYDVRRFISGYHLTTNNPHISVETYYRFVIPFLLKDYKKVVYLDSDLLVLDDIAKLYAVDLGDDALAAVRDLDFIGSVNTKDGRRKEYAQTELHLDDPYDYFQAGVLVINTARMRQMHSLEQWLGMATNSRYMYNDQDLLNKECQGTVTFLDPSWNVMTDCAQRVEAVFSFAPEPLFTAYQQSRQHPRIIHYAGFEKPWNNVWSDFAPEYWHYAMRTRFSAQLLCIAAGVKRPEPVRHHDRTLSENSPLRKYVDAIAPTGSPQREWLKTIARQIERKK